MKIKPQNISGTRDFLPSEVARRDYIFQTIKQVFHKYGFASIETPAIERIETLLGKYGTEGDKLVFKILNSGNFLKKVSPHQSITHIDLPELSSLIVEKGLRYDLTVPLARYVVQHQQALSFPFKRYHIAPVWRADRPQKGRYREFYQCDADVVGSYHLINEVELALIYVEVFERLDMQVDIRINNRKILEGIAETIGHSDKMTDITTAIDKLDKVGLEGVANELSKISLNQKHIDFIIQLISTNDITLLSEVLAHTDIGKKGIAEVSYVLKKAQKANIIFDVSLARGLNYYTGVIFEVVSKQMEIGSIGGGGRYDNLTSGFGGKNMPGVGISFGIERIYDILNKLDLFPTDMHRRSSLILVHFDERGLEYGFDLAQKLRDKNVPATLYTDTAKLKKQLKYADEKKIGYVLVLGEEEMRTGQFTLKNMHTGTQDKKTFDQLCHQFALPSNT